MTQNNSVEEEISDTTEISISFLKFITSVHKMLPIVFCVHIAVFETAQKTEKVEKAYHGAPYPPPRGRK